MDGSQCNETYPRNNDAMFMHFQSFAIGITGVIEEADENNATVKEG
jgi:hypothetical protein